MPDCLTVLEASALCTVYMIKQKHARPEVDEGASPNPAASI